MSDDYAAIAASNIVSALIKASQSPQNVEEALSLYDTVFDHIAKRQTVRPPMTINPSVLNPKPR